MSSEMNYPIVKSKKFLNKDIFENIIDIIFKLYKTTNLLESNLKNIILILNYILILLILLELI